MDDKERNERIRELKNERATLRQRLLVYTSYAPRFINNEQVPDDYINYVSDQIVQIEEINTKLFLLGQ